MCESGKAEYPNLKSVRTALHSCQDKRDRRRHRKRKEASFYICELCAQWHLTSEPANGETRFT